MKFDFSNSSRFPLTEGWRLQNSDGLCDAGQVISRLDYQHGGWMRAQVPGTVLTAYVKNGVYPDPYYGLNNQQKNGLIPDAGTPGTTFSHPHWYRLEFDSPEEKSHSGQSNWWLDFDGINYRAEIYLNGCKLGEMTGSFERGCFVVTQLLERRNVLAVCVHPLPVPGGIRESGCGGDNTIGRNAAVMQQVVGWDFTFSDGVRDRNLGIIRGVALHQSGPVRIFDPFMFTARLEEDYAELGFRTFLQNVEPYEQTVSLELEFDGRLLQVELVLAPNERKEVYLTAFDFPLLRIDNPQLWWPNLKGVPHLYGLKILVRVKNNLSDEVSIRFGIRMIQRELNAQEQPVFKVNGRRIFMNGGAWVQDAMLRATPDRYRQQVRLLAKAGLNWIRLWSGSGQEMDELFDACDEYGILLWVESGLTAHGGIPDDQALHLRSWKDTVYRIRRHSCVFFYCGCNEGPDIEGMADITAQADSTRPYQANSMTPGHRGCPYTFQRLCSLYDQSSTDVWGAGPLGIFGGFCNESGGPCTPPYEVLIEQMDPSLLWPIDEETFRYQDGGGFHNTMGFIQAGCRQYGDFDQPDMAGRIGAKNWAFKGQILGAMAYRAIAELWHRNKWNELGKWSTGYAFWLVNQTHPQLCGRLYNYSLEPNAALFYFAHGNKPLHAQFDYFQQDVSLVNDSFQDETDLVLEVQLRNLDWSLVWSERKEGLSIDWESTRNGLFNVPSKESLGLDDVHFIDVKLSRSEGTVMDQVLYWRSRNDPHYGCDGPFNSLNSMPQARFDVESTSYEKEGRTLVEVKLKHAVGGLAFFIRLKLLQEKSRRLIQPCFYSDNYFHLRPGEERKIILDFEATAVQHGELILGVESWNTGEVFLPIPGRGESGLSQVLKTSKLEHQTDSDLALYRFARATSDLGFSPDMALDGSAFTEWKSLREPNQWFFVDLEKECLLERIELYWGDIPANNWSIQISTDKSSWKKILCNAQRSHDRDFIDNLDVLARYVRLEMPDKPPENMRYTIKHLAIFGRAN